MRRPGLLVIALCSISLLAAPTRAQQARSDTLFTVEKYLDFEQVADPQISPDGAQIVYTRRYVNKMEDRWDASLWLMNADGTRNRFLTKGSSPRWSPDGSRIAFLNDGEPNGTQLFVRYMDAEGATSQVTRVAEPVGDIRWSPDGKWIGFSMFVPKENVWKIDMPAAPTGAKWTAAPKYVTDLHYRQDRRGFNRSGFTHLYIVPADGGTPRALTSGEWNVGSRFDGQAGGVSWDWAPDGRAVYVVGFNDSKTADLNYRNSNIYSVDVESASLKRLNAQDGEWNGIAISADGKKLAYMGSPASKASYHADELYVMNADGSAPQKITTLDRDPANIIWSRDGTGVWFTVAESGTSNVYFAPVTGAGTTRLTTGIHMLGLTSLAKSGIGAGTRTSSLEPADVVRIDLTKRGAAATYAQLTHVNDDVLANVKLGAVERITATSTNNTGVEGWVVKPPSFTPGRKYPLVFEIHGGPHGMYNVGFSASYQNFASNGFVVLYMNPRGSTGYGSAFGNAIEKNYPGPDYDDLMAAVDALVAKGFVDTERMYVGGCSGGGVLSSWVIGHTDRFAAAAVRCPVINWMSFAGHTDIPLFTYQFFDKPFWEDPKPWLDHSSLMYVGKVKTPTLLMTGELDLRTPMPQTEEYFAALKMRGVPTALLRFEGEYHGTSSKPSNWVRTQLYMMSWYNRWPARTTMAGQPTP